MTSMQELKNKAKNLPPVDESVKLPAAIRAAASRSNEIHKQAYQTEVTDAPPVEQPKPEDKAPEAGSEGEQTPPQPETPPQSEAGKEGATPPSGKGDEWEHKYLSLKGRYDKQDETIRGLTGRIGQLEALLARAEKQPQQPTPDLTFKSLITKEDKENFGEDFLDVAARAAQEKLHPEIADLKAKLARLEGTVGSVAEHTQRATQQSVTEYLNEQLPNWRELNRNEKFLAWANLPDPLSGGIRIAMMRDAHQKGDAQRVLRFFQGFLADEAATAPAAAKPDNSNKVPLENFAAPGRATAPAATTPPAEKETITHAQIAQFYADVHKGKYRGNEAEKTAIEQMIFKAQQEGRII